MVKTYRAVRDGVFTVTKPGVVVFVDGKAVEVLQPTFRVRSCDWLVVPDDVVKQAGAAKLGTHYPDVLGGGWVLLRRSWSETHTHDVNDNAAMTAEYGTFQDDPHATGADAAPHLSLIHI